ncbi:TMV resistance protein N [Glycine soja]|uniref:TMV resistance protein N n=1 Tax=Glycine soja TaxID=3848 RepID=A0A445L7U2_GLYSO|nr:TMV resistance protein N [Glycine soja]
MSSFPLRFPPERYQEDNRNYDVFLSFRGEDTRASFTSHLYTALHNAGISVFKDDETLPRGNKISTSLGLAIEESRLYVVVFSRNYANSLWCLQELEKIMECHKATGQVVVPVFYDVDPSEVRHQTGHFGQAFRNLEAYIDLKMEEEMLPGWRKMVCEGPRISGPSVFRDCNGQSEILERIHRHVEHWRVSLREAVSISPGSGFGKMDVVANKIDNFVERWRDGLCVATRIPWRGMLIAEKLIDLLVKHWRITLGRVIFMAAGKPDDSALKHWSEALWEAARISGGADLISKRKEMNPLVAYEIDLLVKDWRKAHRAVGGISAGVVLKSIAEEEIRKDFEVLVIHWKEALHEAADILRSYEPFLCQSKCKSRKINRFVSSPLTGGTCKKDSDARKALLTQNFPLMLGGIFKKRILTSRSATSSSRKLIGAQYSSIGMRVRIENSTLKHRLLTDMAPIAASSHWFVGNPKNQPTVAKSSSEAEYRALASATCELQLLPFLVQDLPITFSKHKRIVVEEFTKRWAEVLREAASISGIVVLNSSNSFYEKTQRFLLFHSTLINSKTHVVKFRLLKAIISLIQALKFEMAELGYTPTFDANHILLTSSVRAL